MQETWSRLRQQAGTLWTSLSRVQRIALVGGVLVLILFVVLFSTQLVPSGYAPLFTQLRPEDAGEIIAVLREQGVPYQVGERGTAILVPQDLVYETRLNLASQGIPRGGVVGFEIFHDSPIGTTDFERMVRYQQALQGELVRTIRELDEVVDARVHIVLPERSLFIRDQRPATASVLLHLRSPLRSEQVRGIAHLVARSVENLDPENVIIVDQRGKILSDFQGPDVARGSGLDIASRFQWQRAYERELEHSVQSMLEKVFGVDRVVVRVRATLNFDLLEERQELFEPVVGDRGILRSQQLSEESYQDLPRSPEAMGTPGVEANVPGYLAALPTEGSGSRFEQIANYEINRTERVRVATPGAVEGLSVAVWLDAQLDQAQLQRVEETVASALGLDRSRGDTVVVEAFSFERSLPVTAPVAVAGTSWWEGPWVWALALTTVVLGVFLLRARRAALATREATVEMAVAEEEVRPTHQEEQVRRSRQETIEKMAREKPEDVARLLRSWLTEDER